MTSNKPDMPASTIPGLIPTLNNTGFMTEAMDPYSEEFAAYAGTIGNEALDIGCAYGIATLAALAQGARVCAADIEPKHLEVLEGRVSEAQRSRLRTRTARMPDVDFPPGSFGAILAARVLHFLTGPEIETVVAKMHRWLVPGGKVFLVADSPYVGPWYTAAAQYEERKRRGDPWPGFLENYAQFLPKTADRAKHPKIINPLDPDILRRVVSETGFIVEKAAFLAGGAPRHTPRSHAGVVGRKPA
jgi:SAM-dependent methyltransferase